MQLMECEKAIYALNKVLQNFRHILLKSRSQKIYWAITEGIFDFGTIFRQIFMVPESCIKTVTAFLVPPSAKHEDNLMLNLQRLSLQALPVSVIMLLLQNLSKKSNRAIYKIKVSPEPWLSCFRFGTSSRAIKKATGELITINKFWAFGYIVNFLSV